MEVLTTPKRSPVSVFAAPAALRADELETTLARLHALAHRLCTLGGALLNGVDAAEQPDAWRHAAHFATRTDTLLLGIQDAERALKCLREHLPAQAG